MPRGIQAVSHQARFISNMDTRRLALEIPVTGWLRKNVSGSFSSCLAGVRNTFLVTYSQRIPSRRCPARPEEVMDSTESPA
jgi:hypothetical protein